MLPPPAAEVVPIATIEGYETIGTQTYMLDNVGYS